MKNTPMSRKEFMTTLGLGCLGSCACIVSGMARDVFAEDKKPAAPPSDQKPGTAQPAGQKPAKRPRSEERMEFAEKWVKRFFDVLDANLDEATRKKIMMANGQACFLAYIKEIGQQVRPVTMEHFAEWVKKNVKDDSIRIEGNVVYYQYNFAAETGLPAADGACLCPLVETKPAGLSPTFCICSVGYVKVMHELRFGRPVEVELLDSVLKGGKHCKFKITVT